MNFIMIYFLIYFLLFVFRACQQNILGCVQRCEQCKNPNICRACYQGYELSTNGQCILSRTFFNCELFGVRNSCVSCKPSFRLRQNRCQKMNDGCLISDSNNQCAKCVYGGILSFGKCQIKFINCKRIVDNKCILCMNGYALSPQRRCVNNDINCNIVSNLTGLCLQCKFQYILLGYECMKLNMSANCLIALNTQICLYCKQGYYLYFGLCKTKQKFNKYIEDFRKEQNQTAINCKQDQYFQTLFNQCNKLPKNCSKFDYGFYHCTHCTSDLQLIFNDLAYQCLDSSHIFCTSRILSRCFDCQPNYYLNSENQCSKYPPFCQKVQNQACIECIQPFKLNSRMLCEDPNCLIFHPQTAACIKCKYSYNISKQTNICTFYDVNCLQAQLDQNFKCKKCAQNYRYDEFKRICVYVDPNCKFDSKKQFCQECNSGYYFNKLTNTCVIYPNKCKKVNEKGYCQLCEQNYFILAGNCKPIQRIPNCQIISETNADRCQKCLQKFYLEQDFSCKSLPALCLQIDRKNKKLCKKCQNNALIKNGLCFDNNCQYFDQNAQCLGCKQGYQYGDNGWCIPQIPVKNCKQFANGQCKVCADRYYFNSMWECVLVSNLCKNYDYNTGQCLTCYNGYIVQDGLCILPSEVKQCDQFEDATNTTCKKCHRFYQLNETTKKCLYNQFGCIQKGADGQCLQCKKSYFLDRSKRYCLRINKNIKESNISNDSTLNPPGKKEMENSSINREQNKSQNNLAKDQNCHTYNVDFTKCEKCVTRSYYNSQRNKCVEIDSNCKSFSQTTGQCHDCFQGYTPTLNKMNCQIKTQNDVNCKQVNPNGTCKVCYQGFFYSYKSSKCVEVDRLCQTYNQQNGQCNSCYQGYALKQGRCILETQTKVLANTSNFSDKSSISKNNFAQKSDVQDVSQTINIKSIADQDKLQQQQQNKDNKYCQKYNKSLQRCERCVSGTIYNEELKKCEPIKIELQDFCQQYRNNLCARCKRNYRLVDRKCVLINRNNQKN